MTRSHAAFSSYICMYVSKFEYSLRVSAVLQHSHFLLLGFTKHDIILLLFFELVPVFTSSLPIGSTFVAYFCLLNRIFYNLIMHIYNNLPYRIKTEMEQNRTRRRQTFVNCDRSLSAIHFIQLHFINIYVQHTKKKQLAVLTIDILIIKLTIHLLSSWREYEFNCVNVFVASKEVLSRLLLTLVLKNILWLRYNEKTTHKMSLWANNITSNEI